jgi:hypothetical protein
VADVDNLTSARQHCDANAIANGKAKAVVGYASYTRGNEKYVPAMIDVVIHKSDGSPLAFPFLVSFLRLGLR